MTLRLRLALIVGTAFALVVVACVFAAIVSARNQRRAEADHFLLQRAHDPGFERGPDNELGHEARERDPFFVPDALVQTIGRDGSVHTFPGQTPLPVDDRDRSIAKDAAEDLRIRTVSIDGEQYRLLTAHQ